jgi:hypothetical protein
MSRRGDEELVDRHIKIRREDWDWLVEHCGPGSDVGLSPGEIIRAMVRQKVGWLRAEVIRRLDELGPEEARTNKRMAEVMAPTSAPTLDEEF